MRKALAMEVSNTGWLTLSSGRRACVGKPATRYRPKRRAPENAQGFFVLGALEPHRTMHGGRTTIAPMEAHGVVRDGRVQLTKGALSIGEALELERAAAELARRSSELLREALR